MLLRLMSLADMLLPALIDDIELRFDMVLSVLADALEAAGIACLRFNFRGVGGSDGRKGLAGPTGWPSRPGVGRTNGHFL